MVLAKEMKTLQEMKESELGVLSIYLSTNHEMRNKWRILLKNEFKEIQSILNESNSTEELKSFLKLRDKVDRVLDDSRGVMQRSIIIFAFKIMKFSSSSIQKQAAEVVEACVYSLQGNGRIEFGGKEFII